jgi:hypothetical protein
MANRKRVIDINDAEHPYRKAAIDILEEIQERVSDTKDIINELWYSLEDYITYRISRLGNIERLKKKIQYLRNLYEITCDERDLYADMAGDDWSKEDQKLFQKIEDAYNELGKEPR